MPCFWNTMKNTISFKSLSFHTLYTLIWQRLLCPALAPAFWQIMSSRDQVAMWWLFDLWPSVVLFCTHSFMFPPSPLVQENSGVPRLWLKSAGRVSPGEESCTRHPHSGSCFWSLEMARVVAGVARGICQFGHGSHSFFNIKFMNSSKTFPGLFPKV